MHVYFVRHGETELNRRHRHQSPITPLSRKGREQALTAGEYLRPINPSLILSSDYTRAQETARLIGSILGKKTVMNPVFREVVRPTRLCGRSFFTPDSILYALLSVLFRGNPNWRYADAENFSDIQKRVADALNQLEALREEHHTIVVVSHTLFIHLITAYMCNKKKLSIIALIPHFIRVMRMKNLDVVHLNLRERDSTCGCAWEIAP